MRDTLTLQNLLAQSFNFFFLSSGRYLLISMSAGCLHCVCDLLYLSEIYAAHSLIPTGGSANKEICLGRNTTRRFFTALRCEYRLTSKIPDIFLTTRIEQTNKIPTILWPVPSVTQFSSIMYISLTALYKSGSCHDRGTI